MISFDDENNSSQFIMSPFLHQIIHLETSQKSRSVPCGLCAWPQNEFKEMFQNLCKSLIGFLSSENWILWVWVIKTYFKGGLLSLPFKRWKILIKVPLDYIQMQIQTAHIFLQRWIKSIIVWIYECMNILVYCVIECVENWIAITGRPS